MMWYGHNSRPVKAAIGLYSGSLVLLLLSFLASLPDGLWFKTVSIVSGIAMVPVAIVATVIIVVDYLDTQ